MLYYNTAQPKMALPEYGRTIQHMVDFCLTIADREERTSCAYAIVDTMSTLFPEFMGENGDTSKFWDHINVMSGFRLDIDFPCEVMTEEHLNPKPRKIPYTSSRLRYRHYGKLIERMVKEVADMEEGPEKDELVSMSANHLKKLLIAHNREAMTDAKVLRDLSDYSEGRIDLDPERYLLHEFNVVAPPAGSKKKKKK
ncbi:MAG: DUF4290 domain-containing protein [Muribaculaceae bacterium]|nr:DUF4290 domain-containing protein [Muribaculaceae bacterium]